jgi:thiamine biosynthesis lipoprotein
MAPIPLRNSAIATSGNPYFRIIDPLTASPIEKTDYSVAYATVIAPTCALADALCTAAMLFATRKEAESWAQEVVELHPDVRFWILSYK